MAVRSSIFLGIVVALCFAARPAVAQKTGKGAKKGKKAEPAGDVAKGEVKEASPAEVAEDPSTLTDPKAKASAYYKLGKAKHDSGDFAAALTYFIEAYNAMPNPAVYIPISDCYEKMGNIQDAVGYLKKYVSEKPDAGNIVAMKEKLAQLEATPGKVKIVSDPPGATITLNGETTELVTPAELELPGGDHAMALSLDDHMMETRAFTVPLGGEVVVEVVLTPTTMKVDEALPLPIAPIDMDFDDDDAPKKKAKVGPGVWAMTGIAGAGLVSATVFGLLALSEQASFDDNPTKSKQSKGNAFAIVCDVSWGVAAAAAVTGTILYFVGAKKAEKESADTGSPIKSATIAPVVTETGAGAVVDMTF